MISMIIGNLLLLLNLTIFSMRMLELKYKNKFVLPIAILIGVMLLISKSYPNLQLLGTLSMFSYYFIFIFLLFKGNFISKLLTIILFSFISGISEILCANLMNLLFHLESADINTFLYNIALLLSAAITYILLTLITKFIKLYSENNLPKSTLMIAILPSSTFLLLINLTEYFETFRSNPLLAFILIGLLIANIITIYIFFQAIEVVRIKNEAATLQTQYDTINSLYQNNFNFLHDTIWKLNHMYEDINEHNYNELAKQVEDLSNNLLAKYNIINSNSSIVSSILNYRINDILEKNIQIKTEILHNNFSILDSQSQIKLFSLLINNAIDSCLSTDTPESHIILRSNLMNSQIIIKCLYSFDTAYTKANESCYAKISEIVEKYHGLSELSFDQNNYCDVIIIFNV